MKQDEISMPPADDLVVQRPVAYGYARVSTGKQKMSPDAQREIIEAYYHEHLAGTHAWGGVLIEPHTSARKVAFLKRPVGKELCDRATRGDCIIVAKFDRGFRSVRDFLFMQDLWKDQGIELRIRDFFGIDSRTNMGRLICGILAHVAEFEAEMIAERTRELKAWQKKHGRVTNGNAGYGFKLVGSRGDKKRVPDPDERRVMAWIVEHHIKGYTWRDMYLALLERGVKTGKGKKEWSASRIRRACFAEYLLRAQEEGTKLGSSAPST